MRASISLALAAKLKLLLEPAVSSSGTKFISFLPPLKKLDFRYSELDLFGNPDTGVDANTLELNRCNFAEIVNQIPADNPVFTPQDDGLLWEIFESRVIDNSSIARRELTEDDKLKLANARKFCEDHFAIYRSYKNNFDQCQLDYKQAKCSMDLATGTEKEILQKEWAEFREKSLLNHIEIAESELKLQGRQAETVLALQTIQELESGNGMAALRAELKLKVDDLFSKGVPGRAGTEYLYTDFSPFGAFDERSPSWNLITLYQSEISALCNGAPAELSTLFADVAPVEGIESISFEYALVSVVREWFSETYLSSQAWKFAEEPGKPVSSGLTPSTGFIPAFINKIVCVRKLSYTQKKTGPAPQKIQLAIISTKALNNFSIKKETAQRPVIRRKSFPGIKRTIVTHFAGLSVSGTGSTAIQPGGQQQKISKWLDLRKNRIARFKAPASAMPLKPENPVSKTEHSFEGIKFIAFECKRLPRCPNPAEGLVWD
jgi:hypothetical protein